MAQIASFTLCLTFDSNGRPEPATHPAAPMRHSLVTNPHGTEARQRALHLMRLVVRRFGLRQPVRTWRKVLPGDLGHDVAGHVEIVTTSELIRQYD